jgi:hypothetical protein
LDEAQCRPDSTEVAVRLNNLAQTLQPHHPHKRQLSNPIATNMSVVTNDNQIFFGQRSHKVQTLAGGYQPAISGDGQPEDLDQNGVYDPFHTAIRESREECFELLPENLATDITFLVWEDVASAIHREEQADITGRHYRMRCSPDCCFRLNQ